MSVIFEKIINVALVLNIFTYCLVWPGQSDLFINTLNYISIGFSTLFLLEAIVKIIGLGSRYFKIGENLFDFVIVIVSVIASTLDIFITN